MRAAIVNQMNSIASAAIASGAGAGIADTGNRASPVSPLLKMMI